MKPFFLTDPALRAYQIGSPDWFDAQKRIIKTKPLIRRCYDLWYKHLLEDAESVPAHFNKAKILELGSGSSYIKELRPEIVTSDVSPGLADMVIDGRSLPFPDASLKAILLTHVFHHIPDVSLFLQEACRVLVPGGVISMVDCAHTPFSRFFFGKIHPEPYNAGTREWSFAQDDSMIDSNQALSWIVFWRDREKFREAFPLLTFEKWEYLPWFSYLLSGGVNLRSLVPDFLVPVILSADRLLKPLDWVFAIHWHLTIRKNTGTESAQIS